MHRLARVSGVDRSLVINYADGVWVPTRPTAAKLAAALGTTPEAVIVDCLYDAWARPVESKPLDELVATHKAAATVAISSLRGLAHATDTSDEFQQRIRRAGRLVLRAIAEELEEEERRPA